MAESKNKAHAIPLTLCGIPASRHSRVLGDCDQRPLYSSVVQNHILVDVDPDARLFAGSRVGASRNEKSLTALAQLTQNGEPPSTCNFFAGFGV
jgi:hypothetical protein